MFIDGQMCFEEGGYNDDFYETELITIGGLIDYAKGESTFSRHFNGYINDLRIVKGDALYNKTFCPFTSAHTKCDLLPTPTPTATKTPTPTEKTEEPTPTPTPTSTPTETPVESDCCSGFDNSVNVTAGMVDTANTKAEGPPGVALTGFELGGIVCINELTETVQSTSCMVATANFAISGMVTLSQTSPDNKLRYTSAAGDCYEADLEHNPSAGYVLLIPAP
tara:strand:- start:254 stop:919 length:666 start_codon:yes stop_codon:yes gene_type:complete